MSAYRAPAQAEGRRAAQGATERRTMSRLAAFGVVAGLAVLGPILESTLGGGRGLAIGFVLMVLAPSIVRAGGPRFHPLDPETFVPVMYFLSGGYSPIVHLLSSKYLTLSYAEANAFQVSYMGAVGCALVCASLSREPKDPSSRDRSTSLSVTPRDWAVIATGLVGATLVGTWVATTGVQRLFTATYAETYLQEEGKGLLVSGWYFIQLAIVHCVARVSDFRRAGARVPRVLLAAIALMITAFLLNTVLGKRGPLVWVLLSVALCLHVSGVRIRRLWMAGAAVALVFYAFAIEGYRTSLGQGAEAQLEAARAGLQRVDNPFVINELEGVFANLAAVVEEEPPLVAYPGESWVNAPLMLVPKPIWPDRPTGLSQRYVMWASPSFAREGGGYAFNATAEGYVNMGLPGAMLEIGFLTFVFYFFPLALCVGSPQGPLTRALAACVASFAYNQFRGELAAMMKIAFAFCLGAAFVHLASAVLKQIREQFSKRAPQPFLRPAPRAGGLAPRRLPRA